VSFLVLDPVQRPIAAEEAAPVSPRLDTLDGKVLGLWNNEKMNAANLLELIRAELERTYSFEVLRGTYDSGNLMPEDGWGDVDRCDAVVLANGDCGACSTSGIVNGIELERRGIPALLVSTEPFVQAVRTSAALRGMPDIPWAVVEHPVASLDQDRLRTRAVSAARQFEELMLAARLREPGE
jgi:hypothetical protein